MTIFFLETCRVGRDGRRTGSNQSFKLTCTNMEAPDPSVSGGSEFIGDLFFSSLWLDHSPLPPQFSFLVSFSVIIGEISAGCSWIVPHTSSALRLHIRLGQADAINQHIHGLIHSTTNLGHENGLRRMQQVAVPSGRALQYRRNG